MVVIDDDIDEDDFEEKGRAGRKGAGEILIT